MTRTTMVVFLGGVFLPKHLDEIEKQSHGVMQHAADALQKAFLRGFAGEADRIVRVVNLPFVGSYPRWYRAAWFNSRSGVLAPNVTVYGRSFVNVFVVRLFSRFFSAFQGLKEAVSPGDQASIVVYSAHLPFLAAARLFRYLRPETRLCVIVPDLPEFMGEGGLAYRLLKQVETRLFKSLVQGFDFFVLLTDAMGDRLGVPSERRVVVEGIYDPTDEAEISLDIAGNEADNTNVGGPIFLYTGTLAARYGIGDLLDAFAALDRTDARLWICGDGDTRPRVEAMVARDQRVRYFGQVPRSRALALQRRADVLVNPRRPEGEFTRYSFPSKTMEYLASGKPIIMHALPAMPVEYLGHILTPPSSDASGLAAALASAANMSVEQRSARGAAARAFVLAQKTPSAQVARILALWDLPSPAGSRRV